MCGAISLPLAPFFGGSRMPEPLVAGNWKMHGTRDGSVALIEAINQRLERSNVDVVICPAVIFLADIARRLNTDAVCLGAQNICEFDNGAYTGEVSGAMLREFNCRYVIVGHSERRRWYHESDQQIADKFVAAQTAGLKPILCVGETRAERDKGKSEDVVFRQLDAVINRAGGEALAGAAIAYEPVWAIGTGQVATADGAQQMLAAVRDRIGAPGLATQLLYGGSVTAENAEEFFAQPDINGALIGGASLDAQQFVNICALAQTS